VKPASFSPPASDRSAAEPPTGGASAEPLSVRWFRGSLSPSTLEAIAEIEAQSLRDEATLWGSDGLAASLSAPHAAVAIAFTHEQPAAYCLISCVAGECEILQIATHPRQQRRGLGRSLLRMVLSQVTLDGCQRALLEVRRGNLAARRLYEQLGFVLDGVRRGYYRPGAAIDSPDHDALLLSCLLPARQSPSDLASEHG
jgi:ribosomal-protein-alanine N-acetyltransferase